MSRSPVEARAAVKAAKAESKLNLRAANARAAMAIVQARGWADALAPVMACVPPTVTRNVNAWAEAADKARIVGTHLDNRADAGDEHAVLLSIALTHYDAVAERDTARADVAGMVTEKDHTLAASVVAASIAAGMVAPRALRRQLGSAMLCASLAKDVEQAKHELTAALDRQAQAVKQLKAAARGK